MANSPHGGYAHKHPDEYYYEKLGPKVRKALQESVTEWSSRWAYKMVQEHGADYVIKTLRDADVSFMKKGFRMKHFEKNVQSSFVAAKVKPQRANW